MTKKYLLPIFLFISFITVTPTLAQTVAWDESVDGDLPGVLDGTVFQPVNLVEGVNTISGSVSNDPFNDSNGSVFFIDAFSFTVPYGTYVTSFDIDLDISSQTMAIGSGIGSYSGSPLVSNIFQFIDVSGSFSLLESFGGGPLYPGEYGLLVNEGTPDGAIYEISITLQDDPSAIIPTLSQWGLIILVFLLIIMGTLYLAKPNSYLNNRASENYS